jgi:hypothetical protein
MTLDWQYSSRVAPSNSNTHLELISQRQTMGVLGILLLLMTLVSSSRPDDLLELMLAGRVPTSAECMVLVSIAHK